MAVNPTFNIFKDYNGESFELDNTTDVADPTVTALSLPNVANQLPSVLVSGMSVTFIFRLYPGL